MAEEPLMHQPRITNIPSAVTEPKTDTSNICLRQITVTRVIGLIIGMIMAGIPLAVMVTLYLQPGESFCLGSLYVCASLDVVQ